MKKFWNFWFKPPLKSGIVVRKYHREEMKYYMNPQKNPFDYSVFPEAFFITIRNEGRESTISVTKAEFAAAKGGEMFAKQV